MGRSEAVGSDRANRACAENSADSEGRGGQRPPYLQRREIPRFWLSPPVSHNVIRRSEIYCRVLTLQRFLVI